VQEWRQYYLDFKKLKKIIKLLHPEQTEKKQKPLNVPQSFAQLDEKILEKQRQKIENAARPHGNTIDTSQHMAMLKEVPHAQRFSQATALQEMEAAENRKSEEQLKQEATLDFADLLPEHDIPNRDLEVMFYSRLQSELNKINNFYQDREKFFLEQANVLVRQINMLTKALARAQVGVVGVGLGVGMLWECCGCWGGRRERMMGDAG